MDRRGKNSKKTQSKQYNNKAKKHKHKGPQRSHRRGFGARRGGRNQYEKVIYVLDPSDGEYGQYGLRAEDPIIQNHRGSDKLSKRKQRRLSAGNDGINDDMSISDEELVKDYLKHVGYGVDQSDSECDEDEELENDLYSGAVARALSHLDENFEYDDGSLIVSSNEEEDEDDEIHFKYKYTVDRSAGNEDADYDLFDFAATRVAKPLPTPDLLVPPTSNKRLNLRPPQVKASRKQPSSATKQGKQRQRKFNKKPGNAKAHPKSPGYPAPMKFVRPSDPEVGILNALTERDKEQTSECDTEKVNNESPSNSTDSGNKDVDTQPGEEESEESSQISTQESVNEQDTQDELTELIVNFAISEEPEQDAGSEASESDEDESSEEDIIFFGALDAGEEEEEEEEVPTKRDDSLFRAILHGDISVLDDDPYIDMVMNQPPPFLAERVRRARKKKGPSKEERQAKRLAKKARKAARKAKKKQYNTLLFTKRELNQWNNAIIDFLKSPHLDCIPLPPMGRRCRLQIHQIATLYNLQSRSHGSGRRRFIMLYKTGRTTIADPQVVTKFINSMITAEDVNPRAATTNKKPSRGKPKSKARNPHDKHIAAAVRPREGSAVGADAAPIPQTSFGHRMLVAMGWTGGSLKANGLSEPLTAIVKTSKLGLGYGQ